MMHKDNANNIKNEAESFDVHATERAQHGFIPDLRKLKHIEWFYNNVWREPEFVQIHWMPKVNFVLDIVRNSPGRILEVGCGSGYLSLEMTRNGSSVVGIDISPKSVQLADAYARQEGMSRDVLQY